jgi:hypothetical protein
MNYSKGISWFDDCRIPFVDNETNTQGRFPANLLVSDDMLNDGSRYYDIDAWFDNLLENYIY